MPRPKLIEAVLEELEGAQQQDPGAEAARLQRLQRALSGARFRSMCGLCTEEGAGAQQALLPTLLAAAAHVTSDRRKPMRLLCVQGQGAHQATAPCQGVHTLLLDVLAAVERTTEIVCVIGRGGAALRTVPEISAHAVPGYTLPVSGRPGAGGPLGVSLLWPAQQQPGASPSVF